MSCYYVYCPYCDEETEIELDGQRVDETYIETCDKCKREFSYYYELSVDFTCDKIEKEIGEEKQDE